jgi:hypothetical protein
MHVARSHSKVPSEHVLAIPDQANLDTCNSEARWDHPGQVPWLGLLLQIVVQIEIILYVKIKAEEILSAHKEHELKEQMIVVGSDAIHQHAAVVVVL